MNIADTLIKQILANTDWACCPNHEGHEEIKQPDTFTSDEGLPPGWCDDAPDLATYLQREPDSYPDDGKLPPWRIDDVIDKTIRTKMGSKPYDRPWHPYERTMMPQSISVLGTYHDMVSPGVITGRMASLGVTKPGVITLYRSNIQSYWRSLLKTAQREFPFISQKEARRVLKWVVYSTYQHERFHYACDFYRRLFGSSVDRWHEEALAVAAEWHWLKSQNRWNTFFMIMHPELRRIIMQETFQHTSQGYRDWRNYANLNDFYQAMGNYLHPSSAQLFSGCNLSFGHWLLAHGADEENKGWIEHIGI